MDVESLSADVECRIKIRTNESKSMTCTWHLN